MATKQRGTTATMTTVAAAAIALTTALLSAGCSSSAGGTKATGTSSTTGAVGAPSDTSAAASGGSTDTASNSAAGGDSAKNFCDDLRDLDALQGPQVGKTIPASTVEVFDRLSGEAPAQIKDAMKTATAAIHGMSTKVDAAGLAAFGTSIKSVTTWASDPAHCPVS